MTVSASAFTEVPPQGPEPPNKEFPKLLLPLFEFPVSEPTPKLEPKPADDTEDEEVPVFGTVIVVRPEGGIIVKMPEFTVAWQVANSATTASTNNRFIFPES
jgi:hypothetical protein